MRVNREKFFAEYRASFGSLEQLQVDGLNFLLDKLEQDTFTLKQQAYILATIQHETGVKVDGELQTFQPIKEKRGKTLTADQKKYWPSGYYGRGYVQITWKRNYEKFGIADDPDKALEPETAYEILSRGMREGLFTGKSLDDYINGTADYANARRIINGTDRAAEIAARARKFEAILTASVIQDSGPTEMKPLEMESQPAKPDETTPPPVPAAEVKPGGAPATGAVSEPDAKEVRMMAMSSGSKALTIGTIGTAILGFFKEAWSSSREQVIDGGKFALAHLPMTLAIIALAALGVYVWNTASKRRDERMKQIVDVTSDKTKNDVVIT